MLHSSLKRFHASRISSYTFDHLVFRCLNAAHREVDSMFILLLDHEGKRKLNRVPRSLQYEVLVFYLIRVINAEHFCPSADPKVVSTLSPVKHNFEAKVWNSCVTFLFVSSCVDSGDVM